MSWALEKEIPNNSNLSVGHKLSRYNNVFQDILKEARQKKDIIEYVKVCLVTIGDYMDQIQVKFLFQNYRKNLEQLEIEELSR
jgi:hypothetical protein